jgi:acylphosphatase
LSTSQHAVRNEVFFSGRVQGVGFRYTVLQLASGLAITGFVRNLEDGRVQLLVEGTPEEIEKLMGRIHESRIDRGIADRTVRCCPATEEYQHFEIRR